MRSHNHPRPIGIDVYDRARASILRKHRGIEGVLAMLEFGTIPLPGISDIDFFIVIEPDADVVLPPFRSYDPLEQYAMSSRQCVISPETLQSLSFYDPWIVQVTPHWVQSDAYRYVPERFSPSAYAGLSLHFLFEKIVYGSLPFIAQTRSRNSIDVRHFFEESKQIKYFHRECKKMGIACPHDPTIVEFDTFAQQWFTLGEEERERELIRLYTHFENSIVLLCSVMMQYASTIVTPDPTKEFPVRTLTHAEYLHRYPRSFVIDRGDTAYVFADNISSVILELDQYFLPLQAGSPQQVMTIVLPWACGCLASQHVYTSGDFSAYVRSLMCTDAPSIPSFRHPELEQLHVLQNRNLHAMRNVKNAKRYEITFGYSPERSLRNMIGHPFRSLHQRCSAFRSTAFRQHRGHTVLFERTLESSFK